MGITTECTCDKCKQVIDCSEDTKFYNATLSLDLVSTRGGLLTRPVVDREICRYVCHDCNKKLIELFLLFF